MKEIEEIELVIGDEEVDGIFAMGWVEDPAIEKDFFYFNKDKTNYVFGKEIEEGKIISPCLIPDKRIYRYDPVTNQEYYVYFTKETIRELAEGFLMNNNHIQNTEQHDNQIDGIKLIFSYIVENEHDPIITKYGYDVPIGTWVVSYKIENEDIRNKIKSGEINGISIEGYLSEKFSKMNVENNELEDKILVEKLIEILKKV
jgi:hypothetical protein